MYFEGHFLTFLLFLPFFDVFAVFAIFCCFFLRGTFRGQSSLLVNSTSRHFHLYSKLKGFFSKKKVRGSRNMAPRRKFFREDIKQATF